MTVTTDHDPVNAPRHYRSHPSGIECIMATRQMGFDIGNAVKYVWRRGDKGTEVQDLQKSMFYLNDARTSDDEGGRHPRRHRLTQRLHRWLTRAPRPLYVPGSAARLLFQVADADPSADAADFYRAVAQMRWNDAELAVKALLAQAAPKTS